MMSPAVMVMLGRRAQGLRRKEKRRKRKNKRRLMGLAGAVLGKIGGTRSGVPSETKDWLCQEGNFEHSEGRNEHDTRVVVLCKDP
jgi:hypothetical protein